MQIKADEQFHRKVKLAAMTALIGCGLSVASVVVGNDPDEAMAGAVLFCLPLAFMLAVAAGEVGAALVSLLWATRRRFRALR